MALLTNDAWYRRVARAAKVPVARTEFEFMQDADLLLDAYRAGKIHFSPGSDLNPTALAQGSSEGASGWYFSGADAGNATQSAATMVSRLAVAPDYAHGYLLVEVSHETALALGAAKPTALDLTNSPLGELNPNVGDHVGRTAPTEPGHLSVREVVLPPLQLSSMSKVHFVPGK